MVETGFAILDPELARQSYAAGGAVTIADAALFYAERWAPQGGIVLPLNVAAHFGRMLARPSVQKVWALRGEG